MSNLIILAGVPGSGKSSWAKSLLDLKYSIISTDEIRRREYGSLKQAHTDSTLDRPVSNNGRVFETFHRQIAEGLAHGVDIVADATFLTRESREEAVAIANLHGAKTHLVLFKNIVQAVDRNRRRDPDSIVPELVMQTMIDRFYDTLSEIGREQYDTVLQIESYA